MNATSLVFLAIAILFEHTAGISVARNRRGTPFSRALWILCQPLFMLAVGTSDFLDPLSMWLRVPLAIILGLVLAFIWLQISSLLNAIEGRIFGW